MAENKKRAASKAAQSASAARVARQSKSVGTIPRQGVDGQPNSTPPSELRIRDVRVTYVWVQPISRLFWPIARNGIVGAIGTDIGYYDAYATASDPATRDKPLGFAWLGRESNFWLKYLNGHDPDDISALQAWQALVPLRRKGPTIISSSSPFVFKTEALLYPFGLAILLNGVNRDEELLSQSVDSLVRMERVARFAENGRGGVRLIEFAAGFLDEVRDSFLGTGLRPGTQPDPFKVVTVAAAVGIDAAQKPTPEILAALNGYATADPQWQGLSVEEADAVPTSKPRQRPGHVVYGKRRARVIWFPARSTAKRRSHALGCYHRNLSLASAQVDALGAFIADTNQVLQDANPAALYWDQHSSWSRAVRLLSALHAGEKSVYRSASLRRQVDDQWLEDLDVARRREGLPRISPTSPVSSGAPAGALTPDATPG